jgi:hypothetical protein
VQARIEREQAELAQKQLADIQRETGKATTTAVASSAPKPLASPPRPVADLWRQAHEEAAAAKQARHHTSEQPLQQGADVLGQASPREDATYRTPGAELRQQRAGPSDMAWQLQKVCTRGHALQMQPWLLAACPHCVESTCRCLNMQTHCTAHRAPYRGRKGLGPVTWWGSCRWFATLCYPADAAKLSWWL